MPPREAEARREIVRLPVTMIYGLRGAGKTALVHNIHRCGTGRLAVCDNESLEPDELAAIARSVASMRKHDGLVIGVPAHADPTAVAQAFGSSVHGTHSKSGAAYVDTVVTVIDAARLLSDFCSTELLAAPYSRASSSDDGRLLADVLTEQIELANVVVLNKLDCVPVAAMDGLVALVTALNPAATLLHAQFGCVPPVEVLATGRFDLQQAHSTTGWAKALAGEPIPDARRHGISALLYHERRPFHPERLAHFLAASWPGVVRSKGIFWIATRSDWAAELSQAGAARRYRAVTSWWAATLEGKSFAPSEIETFLGIPWDPMFGDRRQELAFVGINFDEAALRSRLDACLLSDEELRRGPEVWQTFPDPFPPWGLAVTVRRAATYN